MAYLHKVKSTRKVHTCENCLNDIPAGSTAMNGSGKFEGRGVWIQDYYLCMECHEALKRRAAYMEELKKK